MVVNGYAPHMGAPLGAHGISASLFVASPHMGGYPPGASIFAGYPQTVHSPTVYAPGHQIHPFNQPMFAPQGYGMGMGMGMMGMGGMRSPIANPDILSRIGGLEGAFMPQSLNMPAPDLKNDALPPAEIKPAEESTTDAQKVDGHPDLKEAVPFAAPARRPTQGIPLFSFGGPQIPYEYVYPAIHTNHSALANFGIIAHQDAFPERLKAHFSNIEGIGVSLHDLTGMDYYLQRW